MACDERIIVGTADWQQAHIVACRSGELWYPSSGAMRGSVLFQAMAVLTLF